MADITAGPVVILSIEDCRALASSLRDVPDEAVHAARLILEAALVARDSDICDDGYVDIFQAASILGVSERTVRRWCRSGRLPSVIENGAYAISREDIDA